MASGDRPVGIGATCSLVAGVKVLYISAVRARELEDLRAAGATVVHIRATMSRRLLADLLSATRALQPAGSAALIEVPSLPSLPYVLAARGRRRRVVVRLKGAELLSLRVWPPKRLLNYVAARVCIALASELSPLTEALASKDAFAGRPLEVVPNSVRTEPVTVSETAGVAIVCNAGFAEKRSELIATLPTIRDACDTIGVPLRVVVGSATPDAREKLRNLFPGVIFDAEFAEVRRVLGRSAVLVYPFEFDVLPNVILESVGLGIPTVARSGSDVGAWVIQKQVGVVAEFDHPRSLERALTAAVSSRWAFDDVLGELSRESVGRQLLAQLSRQT